MDKMNQLPSLTSSLYKTKEDLDYHEHLKTTFDNSCLSTIDKLANFALYVPRQALTRCISKYELFKKALNVNGSIVECGVYMGGGLMTFAQLSAILEPINYTRKVIGFDNFKGIEKLSSKDKSTSLSKVGKLDPTSKAYAELKNAITLFDQNRHIKHIPKVELIVGDIVKTVPKYLKKHPELIVSLLYLDCPLYEPTKVALSQFLPRIPKGGVIAFDELNAKDWPGETSALLEEIDLSNVSIQRFSFDTYTSYIVR